jgi:hypothetical protein
MPYAGLHAAAASGLCTGRVLERAGARPAAARFDRGCRLDDATDRDVNTESSSASCSHATLATWLVLCRAPFGRIRSLTYREAMSELRERDVLSALELVYDAGMLTCPEPFPRGFLKGSRG